MANDNKKFHRAKNVVDDEFYTQMKDISHELDYYKEQLRGKRIICPCDWDESFEETIIYDSETFVERGEITLFDDTSEDTIKNINIHKTKENIDAAEDEQKKCGFVSFLVQVAELWGIKSISASGYNPATGKGVKFEDIDYSKYDVVITNPPFSQFVKFLDVMFENNLQFLILGPLTAVVNKDCLIHIRNNEMWIGYHSVRWFKGLNGEDKETRTYWYTNLDVEHRHKKFISEFSYYKNPELYPHYDDFDAIDVRESKMIPFDYEGLMGVPLSFVEFFNPDQFEILNDSRYITGECKDVNYVNGKGLFRRLIIKNKKPVKNQEDQYE